MNLYHTGGHPMAGPPAYQPLLHYYPPPNVNVQPAPRAQTPPSQPNAGPQGPTGVHPSMMMPPPGANPAAAYMQTQQGPLQGQQQPNQPATSQQQPQVQGTQPAPHTTHMPGAPATTGVTPAGLPNVAGPQGAPGIHTGGHPAHHPAPEPQQAYQKKKRSAAIEIIDPSTNKPIDVSGSPAAGSAPAPEDSTETSSTTSSAAAEGTASDEVKLTPSASAEDVKVRTMPYTIPCP